MEIGDGNVRGKGSRGKTGEAAVILVMAPKDSRSPRLPNV